MLKGKVEINYLKNFFVKVIALFKKEEEKKEIRRGSQIDLTEIYLLIAKFSFSS